MFKFMYKHLLGRKGGDLIATDNRDVQDWYEVLEVPRDATKEEIRKAFLRLSKERHPDKGGGTKEAFVKLSEAYAVLSNEVKRRAFDASYEHARKELQKQKGRQEREAAERESRARQVAELKRVQAEQAKRQEDMKELTASIKAARATSARGVPMFFISPAQRGLYHTRQVCPVLKQAGGIACVSATGLLRNLGYAG